MDKPKRSAMRVEPEKLLDVIMAFNSEKTYFGLLEVILSKMMEITNADAGTLYVVEEGTLHFRIIRNNSMNVYKSADDKIDLPPIALSEENIVNISAYAAIRNSIVEIDDVYESEEFNFSGPRSYDKITGYRTSSMLVLPLTATTDGFGGVIGVIQLINAIDRQSGQVVPFGDIYNPPVLPALANISANTLANVMYTKEIQELFHSFVRVMTKAIDERTPYNANHTNNVAKYCGEFAAYLSKTFPKGHELHFDNRRREQLVMAAFLHDIGKITTPLDVMDKPDRLGARLEGVRYRCEIKKLQLENELAKGIIGPEKYEESIRELSEAVLLVEKSNTAGFLPDSEIEKLKKLADLTYQDSNGNVTPIFSESEIVSLTVQKGTLTGAEREKMQEHVQITAQLLNGMAFDKYYSDVSQWARNHHEFLDGSGYPLGLSGELITTETAILTIMDIYDALTASDRPYKKAMPPQKALEILTAMANEGKLNGELVKCFIESGAWEKQAGP